MLTRGDLITGAKIACVGGNSILFTAGQVYSVTRTQGGFMGSDGFYVETDSGEMYFEVILFMIMHGSMIAELESYDRMTDREKFLFHLSGK